MSAPASRQRQRRRRRAREKLWAAQSALAERQVDLVAYERVVADMNKHKRSHDGFLSQTVAIVEVLRDATRAECERLQAEVTELAISCQKLEPASTAPTTSDPETTLEP